MNTLNEKSLTEEEKAVLGAMRLGAEIRVGFHRLKELEEVDERMDLFSAIQSNEMNWIADNNRENGEKYISFVKGMSNMQVVCFLETEKGQQGRLS